MLAGGDARGCIERSSKRHERAIRRIKSYASPQFMRWIELEIGRFVCAAVLNGAQAGVRLCGSVAPPAIMTSCIISVSPPRLSFRYVMEDGTSPKLVTRATVGSSTYGVAMKTTEGDRVDAPVPASSMLFARVGSRTETSVSRSSAHQRIELGRVEKYALGSSLRCASDDDRVRQAVDRLQEEPRRIFLSPF